MEGLQKAYRSISQDSRLGLPSSSSSYSSASSLSADQSGVLVTRPPRRAVSLQTCSKLCAVCFVAGVVVGFILKRRVRRWASKVLKRIKDD
ncbi:uncharacterized protein LOC127806820 [Diospyros lotus]|uniref:uncharacterized protein LOC127806820 n=1 Tax=Diospyros lotus TaxID=55363 RepID=UPI002255B050|nr:uncharacterized protein LOC127806820 [Diospyros lotus]